MKKNNVCTFRGRLAADPVIRNGGKSVVANFTIAANDTITTGSNKQIDKTFWADCVCWDTGAKLFVSKFKKGSLVEVECSAELDSYEDREGRKVRKVKFRVGHFWAVDSSGERVEVSVDPQDEEYDAEEPVNEEEVPF